MDIPLDARIYIAGHKGLVGSAIWRAFQQRGYKNLFGYTIEELNLMDLPAVQKLFAEHRPEYVVLAAAKVGGIPGNLLGSNFRTKSLSR